MKSLTKRLSVDWKVLLVAGVFMASSIACGTSDSDGPKNDSSSLPVSSIQRSIVLLHDNNNAGDIDAALDHSIRARKRIQPYIDGTYNVDSSTKLFLEKCDRFLRHAQLMYRQNKIVSGNQIPDLEDCLYGLKNHN